VVNVQDLFPQNAIDMGLLKNRALIRCFEWIENYVYRKADGLIVMSEGNREFVADRGAALERVHVVPNWVDTKSIRPGKRLNDFRREHNLGDKFVVLFGGTMGWSQGLDVVVEAARLCQQDQDIVWVLVGEGIEKTRLMESASDLLNIQFLPMQSKEKYPEVLAASDVCLVTLHPDVATPAVPSKISTIMAAGRPVVAAFPAGDATRLIRGANCGVVVAPGDATALAQAVVRLRSAQGAREEMGASGRTHVSEKLSRESSTEGFEAVLLKVAGCEKVEVGEDDVSEGCHKVEVDAL
jgi:glycosyltransferase involved in cell wall biosynthesis